MINEEYYNKKIKDLEERNHHAWLLAAENMKRASDNHQKAEMLDKENKTLLKFIADLEPSVLPEGHRNTRRQLLKEGILCRNKT